MNAKLANILKDIFISTQNWKDISAGLVKDFEKIISYPNKETGKAIVSKRRFPVSCDISLSECEGGAYKILTPDSTKRAITYWEDLGTVPISRDGGHVFGFVSNMRLVAWVNMSMFNYSDCSISNRLIISILEQVPENFFNYDGFDGLKIEVARIVPKSAAIFSRYTYDEPITQYLLSPYDYFAIDFKCTYKVSTDCFPAIELGSDPCHPYTPPPCPDCEECEECPPCPECPVLDPSTITGVRCYYTAQLTSENPDDTFIYKIEYDGGEVFPTDPTIGLNGGEGVWVNARNELLTAGINLNVVNYGAWEGGWQLSFGQCDTKLLRIILKVRGSDPLPAIDFNQNSCEAYCPDPCSQVFSDNLMNSEVGNPSSEAVEQWEVTDDGIDRLVLKFLGNVSFPELPNNEISMTVPAINQGGYLIIQFNANSNKILVRPFKDDPESEMIISYKDSGDDVHTMMVYVTGNTSQIQFKATDGAETILNNFNFRYLNCNLPSA